MRVFRRRKGEGKLANKVIDRLLDALNEKYPGQGVGIAPEDFWFQEGYWARATEDLASWGAHVPIPGTHSKITLYSWDTMKQCAKGLTLMTPQRGLPHEYEVVAMSDPE